MSETAGGRSTLLIVAGSGRSGTSTVSGTLSRLGFHVPQPEVPADETNPRGFYEPQWVVDFHKRLLESILVRTNDARPSAVAETQALAQDPTILEELTKWLSAHRVHARVLIKDPRTLWFHDLWRKAADHLEMELTFLTMLRHPVEVARSRDSAYLRDRDPETRRAREISNVAAWCHGILVTEASTRGRVRGFVRYSDLMTDWRSAITRYGAQTELALDLDAANTEAIDSFIDPTLYRARSTWADLAVPGHVRDLAENVWTCVNRLVDDPADPEAVSALDRLHEQYDEMYQFALDLTLDNTSVQVARERRRQREARQAMAAQLRQLRERNKRLRSRLRAARREAEAARTDRLSPARGLLRKLRSSR